MNQHQFESRYRQEWQQFAATLHKLEHPRSAGRFKFGSRPRADEASALAADQFPGAYRRLCNQLAIARERRYSHRLIDELSTLAMRGYQQLYQTPRGQLARLAQFILWSFPQLVRQEARLIVLCAVLFVLPLILIAATVYSDPQVIYTLMDPQTVATLDAMYHPDHRISDFRFADSDVLMFGFYLFNNIGIGFRTFASGIVFAIGTVFILLFNAIFIGATAGYISARGFSETFYPFVIAHSAFELSAIVIAGAAGMKLGLALLVPGRHTRLTALKIAARTSIRLIYGVSALLLLAAFIEAFWSSKDMLPAGIRYGAGLVCWILLGAYLLGSGRRAN